MLGNVFIYEYYQFFHDSLWFWNDRTFDLMLVLVGVTGGWAMSMSVTFMSVAIMIWMVGMSDTFNDSMKAWFAIGMVFDNAVCAIGFVKSVSSCLGEGGSIIKLLWKTWPLTKTYPLYGHHLCAPMRSCDHVYGDLWRHTRTCTWDNGGNLRGGRHLRNWLPQWLTRLSSAWKTNHF